MPERRGQIPQHPYLGSAGSAVSGSLDGALFHHCRRGGSAPFVASRDSLACTSAQAPILLAITDMALQLGLFYKFTARGSIKISRYQVRAASVCGAKTACGDLSPGICRGHGDSIQGNCGSTDTRLATATAEGASGVPAPRLPVPEVSSGRRVPVCDALHNRSSRLHLPQHAREPLSAVPVHLYWCRGGRRGVRRREGGAVRLLNRAVLDGEAASHEASNFAGAFGRNLHGCPLDAGPCALRAHAGLLLGTRIAWLPPQQQREAAQGAP